jgi:gluconokinase
MKDLSWQTASGAILRHRDNVFKMNLDAGSCSETGPGAAAGDAPARWVVMGVAGCGKSSLAQAWARRAGACCIEGDALHSAAARARMAAGLPLDERHRRPWLLRLARAMQAVPGPVVAAASLLRRTHRERLRQALPGLRFVHLQLPQHEAEARCAARVGHFFPAALVASQYASLEPTDAESDVLALDACQPLQQLLAQLQQLQQLP